MFFSLFKRKYRPDPNKKTLYLHIGMGKTGTTALQDFFVANRKLLADNDIAYPDYGSMSGAHHLLSPNRPHFLVDSWDFKEVEEWAPKIAALPQERILLSSELSAWAQEKRVDAYCEALKPWFNVRVVIYLRRQDDILMASYSQQVKAGTQRHKIVDVLENQAPRFNYKTILRPWERGFGAANIIVRPYERPQFHRDDIRCDFMKHVFDIELGDDVPLAKGDPNPRLSLAASEYKRLVNNVVEDTTQHNHINELLGQYSAQQSRGEGAFGSQSLLPAEKRLELIQRYEKVNRAIAVKYLRRKDGRLFQAPLPASDTDWSANELSREEALAITRYLQEQDEKLVRWLGKELQPYLTTERKLRKQSAHYLNDLIHQVAG